MKKIKLVLFFFLVIFNNAFAQMSHDEDQPGTEEKVIAHNVAMGETVVLIAKKYKIRPQDIYEFNPTAVDGISQGITLRIPLDRQVATRKFDTKENDNFDLLKDTGKVPVASQEVPVDNPVEEIAVTEVKEAIVEVSHKVAPGETLSGLAKKYGTTIAKIEEANPKQLKHGLQSGQTIVIPSANAVAQATYVPVQVSEEKGGTVSGTVITITTQHTVQSGETLIGLAKRYGTTVAAIGQANERVQRKGLQAGQVITIPGDVVADASTVIEESHDDIIEHNVQPGETLTGLARKYNTSIGDISEDNKSVLKKGLQAGQVIKIVNHNN